MTKQEIFFEDDPIEGTYPEYGKSSKMLKHFEANKAKIIKFVSGQIRDNSNNKTKYPQYDKAVEFLKKNPDYQLYTIISKDGWGSYPLFMDRGFHLVNCEYKYILVKDSRYKVMNYEQKIFCKNCNKKTEYEKKYEHKGDTVFVDLWTWICSSCKKPMIFKEGVSY